MGQKRMVCIAVLFLMFFNIVHIALAEEPIEIFLDCLDSCKVTSINYSNNIMLELTIKNNLDYWAAIKSGNFGTYLRVDVYSDKLPNGRDSEIYYNPFAESFFIKPRDELKVYIPFDIYNKIDKDNRLGDWRISPKLFFNNIGFYQNPSNSYSVYNVPEVSSPITGNDLQFKIEKPESNTVQGEKSSDLTTKGFWEHPMFTGLIYPIISNLITQIILAIGGIIMGILGLKKYLGKGKKGR